MIAVDSGRAADATADQRGTTPFGGFNLTALRLEILRVLRNKRTLFFVVVFPGVFFFLFGLGNRAVRDSGDIALAYVMISMAVYGAMMGTTSGGASVALERSLGWSRQLRPTPRHPLGRATIAAGVASAASRSKQPSCDVERTRRI